MCKIVEYLASAIDDSVIMCDEIINAVDSVSTNGPVNVMSTVSTNLHKKSKIYNWLLYPKQFY